MKGQCLFVLNNDSQMKRLNYRSLGKNRPTDVLVFDLAEAGGEAYIDGEVYVDIQLARRQAVNNAVSYFEEVARLCTHGLLHLCGYDDHKEGDRKKMWNIQENYLSKYFRGTDNGK